MNYRKTGLMFSLLCLPMLFTACVSSSEHNALQAQVNQMNRQMSSSQTSQADSWSQLMELRQEVAELRGKLDSLSYTFQQAGGAQKMAETLNAHDRALHLLESQMGLDLQMNPGAENIPQPALQGGVISGGTPVLQPAVSVVQPAANTAQPSEKPVQQGSADMAQALYDNGMKSFNSRNYQAALRSFSDFTKTYPKNKLVSNAWFWQGECQYQMKKYAEAALAYQNVIEGYSGSAKAPASYLKQGMSFLQLNKKAAAKQRFNELVKKFPKAPEAARAKQIISQNKL
ncbi:MAG: tol-pal system protein YbgF [Mailhella sp.]